MYDTLIIGRDLSSMIAAMISVRSGRKTVLIMEGDRELAHREAGYTFPLDPRPVSCLADRQRLLHFLKEDNAEDGIRLVHDLLDPAFQVVLSGHRVEVFNKPERLINDMIREFPERAKDINRFYRAVLKTSSMIERWILEDEVRRHDAISGFLRRLSRIPAAMVSRSSMAIRKDRDAFKRILDAQLFFLSNLETDGCLLPLSAAYIFSLPMRGLFHLPGGNTLLMTHLQRRLTEQGGILKDGCSVIRVDTSPEISLDLECKGSSMTLSGQRLIVSAQWEKLDLLFPGRKLLPRKKRWFSSIRPSAYPFSLHMGVHEEGLPENMADYVLLMNDSGGSVTRRNLVFLQTSRSGEIDRAPKGRRAITATIFIEKSPLLISDQELKSEAMKLIDSLEAFLPFLRDNIDYLRVDRSIEITRKYQDMVTRKYWSRGLRMEVLTTLTPRTQFANVFLTGGILRAGLGFEGEIMAGMDSARWAGKE